MFLHCIPAILRLISEQNKLLSFFNQSYTLIDCGLCRREIIVLQIVVSAFLQERPEPSWSPCIALRCFSFLKTERVSAVLIFLISLMIVVESCLAGLLKEDQPKEET